jgi:rhodanese-related sulfurtransferase
MSRRRNWTRILIVILAAVACAAVSNLAASRERKMAWVGDYSRALEIVPASNAAATIPASAQAAPPGAPAAPENASATSRGAAVTEPPRTAPSAVASPAGVPTGVPAEATKVAPAPAAAAKTFSPHPDRASVEITTEDAEALFRQGRLFLDARRTSAYADGHIPGARSFPVWESDIADRVKAFFEEGLDQNAPIVIYCSGGDCEDSHMVAEKLYMVGFNNLLVYKDGFPGWQKRGLSAVKGPKP